MFGLLPFEKWLLIFILQESIREKLLKLALAVIANACLGKANHSMVVLQILQNLHCPRSQGNLISRASKDPFLKKHLFSLLALC